MGSASGEGTAVGDLPPELALAFATGGEMGARMRDLDWSATALGAPASWPPVLRSAVALMLASRAQIIIFWGPEYVALYNDAYIPAMGSKHPDHLGRPGREMWSEVWELIGTLFDGVVASGEAYWAPNHRFMLERHGYLEETYFDISYDPIRRPDGTVGGVYCIVTDTTSRVVGERRVTALSALGSRLGEIASQPELAAEVVRVLGEFPADVPFAVVRLESDEAPIVAVGGAAAADVLPVTVDAETSLRTVDVLVEPPDSAAAEAFAIPVTAGHQTVGVLVLGLSRHLARDDAYLGFCRLVAAQVSNAVANLRAYEHERAQAAALAALDEAKTSFFSNVSHELRTPLTLILGPLEDALATPGLAEDARERLEVMQRNGFRLLKLVNTVLDFSRISAGRLRAAYQPTDLADYTARLASTFRSAIDRAGLRLVVDCPPLPAPVHVDREMWEKIILNLLSNALKFTFTGGVTVRMRAAGPVAVIEVADTGVGVPADEIPQLFERFYRVPGVRSRSHEGTGIGLALVRELIEQHGGTVAVTSTPGEGSVFRLTVPFGTAHLPADRLIAPAPPVEQVDGRQYLEETRQWLAEEPPPAAGPAPRVPGRGRILLADDNADLRDHVARLLRPHWDVVAVADGRAALDAALGTSFDLVLADVMMPRMDGFALVESLRRDSRTSGVPVIILSARAGDEASVEGLAAGADDYLVKPFTARDLVARVRANLELGRIRGRITARLRALVDAAADLNAARSTTAVIETAAGHALRMVNAGKVVATVRGTSFETRRVEDTPELPSAVVPLAGATGDPLGELAVWRDGHDPTPFDEAVLAQLGRLVGIRLENARLYEAEHRIATTLQHSLLPRSLPKIPGAVTASRYLSGSAEAEVGGDWYDVIAGPDGRLDLVIGDVVGKGVHAAAAMGQLRNALRAYLLEGFDPGEALTRLNRLVDNLGRRQFATVVCVRYDPVRRDLWFASAGHPSPVVITTELDAAFLHGSALGPPIGALPQATYRTERGRLSVGSRLLLYTDGLIEDRRQGIDTGLQTLLVDAARPADHVEDLIDAMLRRVADQPRHDDIALLALEAARADRMDLRLPADPNRLSVLRRRLDDFLGAHGVPENEIFDLTVAVSEAAANAIEHPVAPREPVIDVTVRIEPGPHGTPAAVEATIRDSGSWRPEGEAGFRGRGLALIRALATLTVERSESGTALTLRRTLPPG
ncbi:SpoIIE family protein phosphatase [Catenuloplanes indicus]|uniref:histidine kinase n=1 Tax=Catenuloplanes indicus TaxID=137267 RepID=A0AAE4B2N2_9ACTN|nr:SpoIIE family protein phosphatase [Catenuloplanes indicus]MDQ0369138.1 signal transduction histidine kinase/CheY-like chemotaxis protein/anti-sigma regulatory factor (Ser/Thr protein kinase) [Catenuloplanes indicus]